MRQYDDFIVKSHTLKNKIGSSAELKLQGITRKMMIKQKSNNGSSEGHFIDLCFYVNEDNLWSE